MEIKQNKEVRAIGEHSLRAHRLKKQSMRSFVLLRTACFLQK